MAVFLASWGRLRGSQERKNADSLMRNPLFRKSSFWSLGAPFGSLGLLLASPGPVLGPRWLPKGTQKGAQNGPKNGSKNGSVFGALSGPFWGPKRVYPGGTFLTFFYQKLQFRKGHSAIFDISKNAFFCVFFAFKSQKLQFRKGHSAIFAFPENAFFY